jgi:hypothetical protein
MLEYRVLRDVAGAVLTSLGHLIPPESEMDMLPLPCRIEPPSKDTPYFNRQDHSSFTFDTPKTRYSGYR